MAIIGSFYKSGEGFIGTIKTLSLKVKAEIRPSEKPSDAAPNSAQPGRKPQPRGASIFRSSLTIRQGPRQSMPLCLRPKTARA